jgi:hypothetical protein
VVKAGHPMPSSHSQQWSGGKLSTCWMVVCMVEYKFKYSCVVRHMHHMILHPDDMSQFKLANLLSHLQFWFALLQKVKWSKNMSRRNMPALTRSSLVPWILPTASCWCWHAISCGTCIQPGGRVGQSTCTPVMTEMMLQMVQPNFQPQLLEIVEDARVPGSFGGSFQVWHLQSLQVPYNICKAEWWLHPGGPVELWSCYLYVIGIGANVCIMNCSGRRSMIGGSDGSTFPTRGHTILGWLPLRGQGWESEVKLYMAGSLLNIPEGTY